MDRFFNMDNKFFTFMGRVGDLMILNVLWLICCIPIVTIGPSTAALYYSMLKIARNEDTYTARMFFHSFRQNLKQGIFLTLIYLLIGIVLYVDIRVSLLMENLTGQILLGLFLVLGLGVFMTLSYTFPILAQFENSLKGTLKNAFLMCLCHLPSTLVILVLDLLPLFLFLFSPYHFFLTLPVWMFLGVSIIARINAILFVRIFQRYMPKEEEETLSEQEL